MEGHRASIPLYVGSSPTRRAKLVYVLVIQWIEILPSKQKVGGSSPSEDAKYVRHSGSMQEFTKLFVLGSTPSGRAKLLLE